jgi:hypothetical protein
MTKTVADTTVDDLPIVTGPPSGGPNKEKKAGGRKMIKYSKKRERELTQIRGIEQIFRLCWPTDLPRVDGQSLAKPPKMVLHLSSQQVYIATGEGDYPYDCPTQEDYPNAMIYKSDGAWFDQFDGHLSGCLILES